MTQTSRVAISCNVQQQYGVKRFRRLWALCTAQNHDDPDLIAVSLYFIRSCVMRIFHANKDKL